MPFLPGWVREISVLTLTGTKRSFPCLSMNKKQKNLCVKEDSKFWVNPEEFEKQCLPGDFVTHSETELKPFIIQGRRAYMHRYFQYETKIINNITRIGVNFHIITGGPGTGKTYSVATELVKRFGENRSLKVALAAPTGKAAVRMKESITKFINDNETDAKNGKAVLISDTIRKKLEELDAITVHRLLGYIPDSVFFRHNEKHRLPHDLIIIDECSMVDGPMMAKLLDAVDDRTVLFLLGDKDQLASVEAGSVFGDLCRSADSELLKNKVDLKTESRRFQKDRGIGKFSQDIIRGNPIDLNTYKNDEQVIVDLRKDDDKKEEDRSGEDLFRENALKYIDYIKEADIDKALVALNRIRFLCVTRENLHSVAETNGKIKRILYNSTVEINKQKTEAEKLVFEPKSGFYHNQPVIITKNDYNLGVYNGDVGLIRKDGDTLFAWFPTTSGKAKKIQAGYLNHYDTVFAMTIHKSQGSEFDNVVVILPDKQGEKLLTRELLYTGLTRAKSKVLLQTSPDAFEKCMAGLFHVRQDLKNA